MTALLVAPFCWLLLALAVAAPKIVAWFGEDDTTTYTLLNDDGTLSDLTRADRDALLAQGWVEIEIDALTPTSNLTERSA